MTLLINCSDVTEIIYIVEIIYIGIFGIFFEKMLTMAHDSPKDLNLV